MVKESFKHRQLKEKAFQRLRDMGFKDDEIFEEYKLEDKENETINSMRADYTPPSYHLKWVDVVGKNEDRIVFIECGNIDNNKIEFLKKLGEVIILPYRTTKCVTISLRLDQIEFINNQRRVFNLSRFFQSKLDEYIKFKKGLRNDN